MTKKLKILKNGGGIQRLLEPPAALRATSGKNHFLGEFSVNSKGKYSRDFKGKGYEKYICLQNVAQNGIKIA